MQSERNLYFSYYRLCLLMWSDMFIAGGFPRQHWSTGAGGYRNGYYYGEPRYRGMMRGGEEPPEPGEAPTTPDPIAQFIKLYRVMDRYDMI